METSYIRHKYSDRVSRSATARTLNRDAVQLAVSTATASRNLHQGVKRGLLKRSGDKRTSVYQFKPSRLPLQMVVYLSLRLDLVFLTAGFLSSTGAGSAGFSVLATYASKNIVRRGFNIAESKETGYLN